VLKVKLIGVKDTEVVHAVLKMAARRVLERIEIDV
jgi:hypothetical protein